MPLQEQEHHVHDAQGRHQQGHPQEHAVGRAQTDQQVLPQQGQGQVTPEGQQPGHHQGEQPRGPGHHQGGQHQLPGVMGQKPQPAGQKAGAGPGRGPPAPREHRQGRGAGGGHRRHRQAQQHQPHAQGQDGPQAGGFHLQAQGHLQAPAQEQAQGPGHQTHGQAPAQQGQEHRAIPPAQGPPQGPLPQVPHHPHSACVGGVQHRQGQEEAEQGLVALLHRAVDGQVHALLDPQFLQQQVGVFARSRQVDLHGPGGGAGHHVHVQAGAAHDFRGHGLDFGLGLGREFLHARHLHPDGRDALLAQNGAGGLQGGQHSRWRRQVPQGRQAGFEACGFA